MYIKNSAGGKKKVMLKEEFITMIKEFENPEYYQGKPFPELDRYRQYLFSLDIDLSRVHTNKKWLASILKHINIIKVPFPTLEINEVDGIKFSPLYF